MCTADFGTPTSQAPPKRAQLVSPEVWRTHQRRSYVRCGHLLLDLYSRDLEGKLKSRKSGRCAYPCSISRLIQKAVHSENFRVPRTLFTNHHQISNETPLLTRIGKLDICGAAVALSGLAAVPGAVPGGAQPQRRLHRLAVLVLQLRLLQAEHVRRLRRQQRADGPWLLRHGRLDSYLADIYDFRVR